MSNRVGLREDQQMGHGLAEKIIGWLPTPPVAVRLAGDSDLENGIAGKPDCYGADGVVKPEAGSPASKDVR
jgi:hypothetical protein